MRKGIAGLALMLALGGCTSFDAAWSGANNYYSGQLQSTVRNIQSTNDNNAKTWADAGCAVPYGEMVRNGSGNPNLPAAIVELCGAPSGFTMTHTSQQLQAIQIPSIQMQPQQPQPTTTVPNTVPAAGTN